MESIKPIKNKSENTNKPRILTAPLPDPIGQNIETAISLQAKAEQNISNHQRFVERMTASWGRPFFLYLILLLFIFWITYNSLAVYLDLPDFDVPPFNYLDIILGFGSLMMTIWILITQRRQEQLAEQRAQLSLQLNLLSEQKIAKIIALIEELREELPELKSRIDVEAEVMKQATDPEAILATLENNLVTELEKLDHQD